MQIKTTKPVDILIIDDDNFAQKMIQRALTEGGFELRAAMDGESGLEEARKQTPDIIILDVEMPGLSGYEVCNILRQEAATADVPVIFLSSHTSLRERMQGYEVGADDYLVKPFDAEHLLAKIKVLIKYQQERKELKAQYELAQKTAMTAMTGTSELAVAMHFIERTYSYNNFEALANGLFQATDQFQLSCCLMVCSGVFDDCDTDSDCDACGKRFWFASDGSIKPLEQELLEMTDEDKRFLDFGLRTIVNYPGIKLLVRNMPLDNMEFYGRIKDILPVLLSAMETKINSLKTEQALREQSNELLESFGHIRTNLYHLAKRLVTNQESSAIVMQKMTHDLNDDLLGMGLEEDQEEFLLHRIDTAIEDAASRIDASSIIAHSFTTLLEELKKIAAKQEALIENYNTSHASAPAEQVEEVDDNIELF
ncbi:MAG: response regulator [Candidatus Polarisedimenticolaceae bacterium]|nr:response regulator [Candidatus Polarisedimenticolaceae bacterium]